MSAASAENRVGAGGLLAADAGVVGQIVWGGHHNLVPSHLRSTHHEIPRPILRVMFVHAMGAVLVEQNCFSDEAEEKAAEQAWQDWFARSFA